MKVDAIFSFILFMFFCEYCVEYNAAFTIEKKIDTNIKFMGNIKQIITR